MSTYVKKTQNSNSQSVVNEIDRKQNRCESTFQFIDNRPEAIAQRKLQKLVKDSSQVKQSKAFQELADSRPQTKRAAHLQEEADNHASEQHQPVRENGNNTGLPDLLNSAITNQSGHAMEEDTTGANPIQLQGPKYNAEAPVSDNPIKPKHLQTPLAVSARVVQGYWDYDDEGDIYDSSELVDGKWWQYRLQDGEAEYRYTLMEDEEDDFTKWDTASHYTALGFPPPAGAIFAEQRRGEANMDDESNWKYAFVGKRLDESVPMNVRYVQERLIEGVNQIKASVSDDKAMLDAIIAEEFERIETLVADTTSTLTNGQVDAEQEEILRETFSPEDVTQILRTGLTASQQEDLKAGLRYKRVYEHEQNLLTINRRSEKEFLNLIETLEGAKKGLGISKRALDEDELIEQVSAYYHGETYDLGTFYFEDERFEEVKKTNESDRQTQVYRHRSSKKEYVKDRYGRFVRRYVTRAIRFEDVESMESGGSLPTKMDYADVATGKEASDYGDRSLASQELTHEQKVMGQIRGYSRFLSATTSGRLATSTSRGTYRSPFGSVTIDLAKLSSEMFTDAHTQDAIEEIFDIEDLGIEEFIPKHLGGGSAESKAARDAYRAREVVLDTPPVEAIETSKSDKEERGILIVGMSGSITDEELRDAVTYKYRSKISFTEVNTRYKRTVDGHKGHSAFLFFNGVAAKDLRVIMTKIKFASSKIHDDAYIKEVSSGYVDEVPKDELAIKQKVVEPSRRILSYALDIVATIPAKLTRRKDLNFERICLGRGRAVLSELETAKGGQDDLIWKVRTLVTEMLLLLGDACVAMQERLPKQVARTVDIAGFHSKIALLEKQLARLKKLGLES